MRPRGGKSAPRDPAAASRQLMPWYSVRGECMMDVDSAAPAADHTPHTHTAASRFLFDHSAGIRIVASRVLSPRPTAEIREKKHTHTHTEPDAFSRASFAHKAAAESRVSSRRYRLALKRARKRSGPPPSIYSCCIFRVRIVAKLYFAHTRVRPCERVPLATSPPRPTRRGPLPKILLPKKKKYIAQIRRDDDDGARCIPPHPGRRSLFEPTVRRPRAFSQYHRHRRLWFLVTFFFP